jgi:hypothetical protein
VTRAADSKVYDGGDLSLEKQVQNALNLGLTLKNRAQMPALLATIESVQPKIDAALAGLHYVHFARFLPTPDFAALQVVTSYDGDLESYLMDFVVVLGDEFNAILEFIQGAPPLPVQQFPREFVAFVQANNLPAPVWTAYPHVTVIDILKAPNSVR